MLWFALEGLNLACQQHTAVSSIWTWWSECRDGCRVLERGSNLLGLHAKGGSGGYNHGPSVKKPTSWAKRGSRPKTPPPPGSAAGLSEWVRGAEGWTGGCWSGGQILPRDFISVHQYTDRYVIVLPWQPEVYPLEGMNLACQQHTAVSSIWTWWSECRDGCRILECGSNLLDLHAKKGRGWSRGYNFGPSVKKPTLSGVEIRCIVIAQHKCFSPNASDVS